MIKRRLTRESLTELAKRMPVLSEDMQRSYVGGGDGTFGNPYSYQEYLQLNSPRQVYYLNESGNLTYALSESVVIAYRGTEYKIAGGTLVDTPEGVEFHSDSGIKVWFPFVDISTSIVNEGTAYNLTGTIHIDKGWLEKGFGINDFLHEFGHYLQEIEMGFSEYVTGVAIPSMLSLLRDPESHDSQPFEQDATKRGQEFWNKWLENHEEYWNNYLKMKEQRKK